MKVLGHLLTDHSGHVIDVAYSMIARYPFLLSSYGVNVRMIQWPIEGPDQSAESEQRENTKANLSVDTSLPFEMELAVV